MNKRNLSWGAFFIVPLVFVLSMLLPEIVALMLAPAGVVIAIAVAIFDICCKMFFKKEQVFKMFVNFMLVGKTCMLYECQLGAYISAFVAVALAFIITIYFSISLDKLGEEAEKINKL